MRETRSDYEKNQHQQFGWPICVALMVMVTAVYTSTDHPHSDPSSAAIGTPATRLTATSELSEIDLGSPQSHAHMRLHRRHALVKR